MKALYYCALSHSTNLLPSLSEHVYTVIGVRHVCEGFMHTKKNITIIITPTIIVGKRTVLVTSKHELCTTGL